MGIVFGIASLVVLGIGLFLMYKILKWVSKKKGRLVWMFSLLGILIVSITVKTLFFTKMEFIQSQVYSDLYLIKNPLKDREKMNIAIQEMVIERSNSQLKLKNQELNMLRFYEYDTGDWGENGTAYFINRKERNQGMLPELLEYYPDFLMARFERHPCESDSSNNWGKLDYYNNRKITQTDALFNSCNQ